MIAAYEPEPKQGIAADDPMGKKDSLTYLVNPTPWALPV